MNLLAPLKNLRNVGKRTNNQILSLVSYKINSQMPKNFEEDLNLQLKRRIQEFEKLAEEIMQFKRKINDGSIKSMFENRSRIIDDILSSQIP